MQKHIDILNEFLERMESGEIQDNFNNLTVWRRTGGMSILLGGKAFCFKPQWGICALLETVNTHCNVRNFDLGRAFTDYVIGLGVRSFTYPVGGMSEFEGNKILWWECDETGSNPKWERRIALLKGFIGHLAEKENENATTN